MNPQKSNIDKNHKDKYFGSQHVALYQKLTNEKYW